MRFKDSNPPESFEKIDLNGLSQKERRQLLARIRAQALKKRRLKLRWSNKIEAACDNLISQIKDLSGETISRGLAVRLIGGTQMEIAGRMFRSSAYRDLFRPRIEPAGKGVLARFNRLAEQIRAKNVR